MGLFYTRLDYRQILKISGVDTIEFLQGLISNDARILTQQKPIYAAFLTPQGKFLEDLLITLFQGDIWMDSFKESFEDFKKKLTLYKLRQKVILQPIESHKIYAIWGKNWSHLFNFADNQTILEISEGIIFKDPRLNMLGGRAYLENDAFLKQNSFMEKSLDDYDEHRMKLGIPDGARDLQSGKAILLENGFDDMGAIDWEKGCYLGQELTARTKYRGLVRKRLLPFSYIGTTPIIGDVVHLLENSAGEIKSVSSNIGLGLFRLEYLKELINNKGVIKSSGTIIHPFIPEWMKFNLSEDF
ncbi:MAG: folate-binding protein [Alphaproteobacteria bacterium]|nr:folate-binding protein [Alphaproteobacteria bacterium]